MCYRMRDRTIMKWIILTIAVAAGTASSVCPKDISQEVSTCLEPLSSAGITGRGGQGELIHLMSSWKMTSKLCRQDSLPKMFSCLHRVYHQCAKAREGAERLGLIIDPTSWERAIKSICDNVDYLLMNENCQARAQNEFGQCLQEETEAYKDNVINVQESLEARDPNGEGFSDTEKLETKAEMACLFSMKIQDCLRTSYENYCPQQLTNLLVNILKGFMPPACSDVDPAYVSSDQGNPGPRYNNRYDDQDPQTPHGNSNIKNNYNSNNNGNRDFVRQDEIVFDPDRNGGKTNSKAVADVYLDEDGNSADDPAFPNPEPVAGAVGSDKDGAMSTHAVTTTYCVVWGVLVARLVSVVAQMA